MDHGTDAVVLRPRLVDELLECGPVCKMDLGPGGVDEQMGEQVFCEEIAVGQKPVAEFGDILESLAVGQCPCRFCSSAWSAPGLI